ncbi:hypothetical protein Hypma_006125 [Hypsizygus marmoreus]|uniref:Uncharacterized protein n=1 Tax=Hypsizygus marmoreus TaxID=39966 RepID=A0A369K406_HYPMA|nr:hypothetical protein Hypma_006125 [Hypsizygus marmoreus]
MAPDFSSTLTRRWQFACLSVYNRLYLRTPPPQGLQQMRLSGIFHSYDFERIAGCLCMAFGHNPLAAQLSRDAMSFVTKALPRPGNSSYDSKTKPDTPNTKTKGMLVDEESFSSPHGTGLKGFQQVGQSFPGFLKSFLEFDDLVPIYDGRKKAFFFLF